jgi:hypothetical protein
VIDSQQELRSHNAHIRCTAMHERRTSRPMASNNVILRTAWGDVQLNKRMALLTRKCSPTCSDEGGGTLCVCGEPRAHQRMWNWE